MVHYRRNFLPGASYFLTIALLSRTSSLLLDHITVLRDAFRAVRTQRPFGLGAVVVLPEHSHCIWTLPSGGADYPGRRGEIKPRFSPQIPNGEWRCTSRVNKGERGIWQRRYWEHTLPDERDRTRHVDYIHFNPVKHGHVSRIVEWPYSSFHQFVRQGIYPIDWCGGEAGGGGSGE